MAAVSEVSSSFPNLCLNATIHDEHPPGVANIQSSGVTVDHWTSLIRANLEALNTNPSDLPSDISEEILNAPRRKSPRDSLAHAIAANLHPGHDGESLAPIIQYEKDVVRLRAAILQQRRDAIEVATDRNASFDWIKRITKQGPWNPIEDPVSLSGAPALPMPVAVSDSGSLAPFFAHLREGGTHEPASVTAGTGPGVAGAEPYYKTELLEFDKGVLYADGRLDLCKMVTGPRNIGELMDSLRTNDFAKHFLLGNNVIGPTGAKAIAEFISDCPDKMETWYLAGNCIDGGGFKTLVNAMVKSSAITNIWLKRNPLGSAAAEDVFRMISQTPNLRTVDLDQTELGDDGVAELFASLADHENYLPLRHIYLNATGIGKHACGEIARYLSSPYSKLESLYLSNNPMGNEGALALSTGLAATRTLKRLSLQSCGLSSIPHLLQSITDGSTIETLDLGQGYATEDLGMRYNYLTRSNTAALHALITHTPTLKYLNLPYTALSQADLNTLLEAATHSPSLLWLAAKPLFKGSKDAAAVKAGQEGVRLWKLVRERLHANVERAYGVGVDYETFTSEHKRFLVSPGDVRFIDSVYRNRDGAAAKRGLKVLEKWWGEEDETLKRIQEGTFV